MSPVHLRNPVFQRNQPEDREGLSESMRPGGGNLGHSGGWKEIERNHTHSATQISNSTETSDQRTGKIFIKFFSSTNSSKAFFQWSMDNKRFNLASHWAELGASFQRIYLKEIDFKDLIVITKGWNSMRQFKLLEVRGNRIRDNQANIQAIE
ncbi:hypothetical protein O181_069084 [Austropuccinia psidii MF-1]|uniref:Uncharacterized protein n=1 Tax=Austropuccinia psidii MF-1 TaxID=1389203 RepID=A0A9Q3EYK8_9BASI|nr:hypothetical protein [Austropuccinia psidii MF-1]